MKISSILNDVLGPVMTGPSSSHTAAPGKIGLTVRQLWGREITAADVIYEVHGSYPSTHVGQGSDFGFAAGLLGLTTDNPSFRNSLSLAQKQNRRFNFRFADLGMLHPNEARIDVFAPETKTPFLSVLSFSTGGGTFLIPQLDGFAVQFDGQRKVIFICCHQNIQHEISRFLKMENAVFSCHEIDPSLTTFTGFLPKDAVLFEIEASSLSQQQLPERITTLKNLLYIRTAGPLVPAPLKLVPQLPFTDAAGAIDYADRFHLSMAGLSRLYEKGISSLSDNEANLCMAHVLQTMRTSMIPPSQDDPIHNLIFPRMAAQLEQITKLPLDLGVLNHCIASAIAVMENDNGHRVVVAAPTAGSSGVIPAAVISVANSLHCSDEQIIDALWATGLVGAFIANQATFGAEVAGCQAEIGAAASMAAAGVVQLSGGSVLQGFHAASIAMQSFLGLICDPVGGLAEFPCIERNVTASAAAVMSAEMALIGIPSLVPLDETIQTMLKVGTMLPDELRCTCRGGLCITKTGCTLAQKVNEMQLQGH